MASSKQLAGLVGPTIVAMIVSEFPLARPHLYDTQIPPVVYLSGVLMFVAGEVFTNRIETYLTGAPCDVALSDALYWALHSSKSIKGR